jgi:hypothetical protein
VSFSLLQSIGAAALLVAAWVLPRRNAGTLFRLDAALWIDLAPFAILAVVLAVITGRPIFGGFVVVALAAGFVVADQAMRDTLREPVVFQAMSELPQVFTHPHLYLPFAGPVLVVGGAIAAISAGVGMLVFLPPVWSPQPAWGLGAAAAIVFVYWRLGSPPLLARVADRFRRLDLGSDPVTDAARLGPFTMLVAHCTIARAERGARQQALMPGPAAPFVSRGTRKAPIIAVQCESFFDARRLSPLVPPSILGAFAECCGSAAIHGGLVVPGWGANTMRAEFAFLTGISEAQLGYDRFNPYYKLARVPIASHVWRLRQAGYHTVCLHPFDRRFFRRDLVMPALGFERFLGHKELGGTKQPPYQPDPDLARRALRVLDEDGPETFLFLITMGNHGPWLNAKLDAAFAAQLDPAVVPQMTALLGYVDGLRRCDEMLRVLMDGLSSRYPNAVLALYGDHLPSLPRAFDYFGFTDLHSDYVIWPGGGGSPRRIDMPVHRLGQVLVDTALGGGWQAGTIRAAQ